MDGDQMTTRLLQLFALSLALTGYAEVSEQAHYKLKAEGAVLKDVSGNGHDLGRAGDPQTVAEVPENRPGNSVTFNGKTDWYRLGRGVAGVGPNFVLEAWARAARVNDPGLHGVVSLGNGRGGYTIAQQDGRWVAFVGGTGGGDIGPVTAGQWVHLAIVRSASGNRTYLNGAATGTCGDFAIQPTFTIGDMGHGKEAFDGAIHEVRLSTFASGAFDAETDLLLDPDIIRAVKAARLKPLLELARPQPGVRAVTTLDPDWITDDWLVKPVTRTSGLQVAVDEETLTARLQLGNGLVTRSFFVGGNLACYSFRTRKDEFLRALNPEAKLKVNGKWYDVGGLSGQPVRNYLIEPWLSRSRLHATPDAFRFTGFTTSTPQAEIPWKPRWGAPAMPWPPKGLHVAMRYAPPPALAGLNVTVHYEIYEGIPVIGKWLSFENAATNRFEIEDMICEELSVVDDAADRVFVESEYNFFQCTPVRWYIDPAFTTDSGPIFTERMSDYRLRFWAKNELDAEPYTGARKTPEWNGEYRGRSQMRVKYPFGPAKTLATGEKWRAFKVWELLQDSTEMQRKGLARCKLYRRLMPWVLENPVYMHVRQSDSRSIRHAVDQCAAVGFDMVVISCGSGFNMRSRDPKYIARVKADFDYAHSKGIKIGAYVWFVCTVGRGANMTKGGGGWRALCYGSTDGPKDQQTLLDFMEKTGMDLIETDGPYHGFPCHSTGHPGHKGFLDSFRVNWEGNCRFYEECARRGIYVMSPDWYYAARVNRTPMGYKETNWSLPREQQIIIARQNIYDGTLWRVPSMSFMFLPLVNYHGRNPNATIEPLSKHLAVYDAQLAQFFGMGVMAAYRGPRIFDTDETKDVVKGWVDFYRKYERVLTSDIIHVRRPDGRDLDCMLHANPTGKIKGLAFVWNPTGERVQREFELPLYYTGLTETAKVSEKGGTPKTYQLDREYMIRVPVDIPANVYTWFVVE
jgi:hypothetical protein